MNRRIGEARIAQRALHKAPDTAVAVAKHDRQETAQFQHPKGFAEGTAEQCFVALGSTRFLGPSRVHDDFRPVVGSAAEPGFVKEAHVAIENVQTEGGIGEDIVDRCIAEMRKAIG